MSVVQLTASENEFCKDCNIQEVEGEDFDVIAFETVPALKEAQAIAHLLRTEPPGKPAWLTFNCRDDTRLADGSDFAKDAVPLAFEVHTQCQPGTVVARWTDPQKGRIWASSHHPVSTAEC